jgi:hypothetical protein
MGPAEMRSRDAHELFNAGVEVKSLPGMFSTNTGTLDDFDEAQQTTEMAATLLYLLQSESAPKSTTPCGRPGSDMQWA